MKKIAPFLIFVSLGQFICAQEVSLSFAPTMSNFYHIFATGGPSGNGKLGADISLEYLFRSNSRFSFGFGLEYQHARFEVVPAAGVELEPHSESLNLLSVSLKGRYNFLNEFFISVQPLVDFQLEDPSPFSIDKQTGIGLSFSFGKGFRLQENLYATIEPILWIHNIIPLTETSSVTDRLVVLGIKAGLSLRH